MSKRQATSRRNPADRSAAGGSHGGRGFRYQDEVAAAVAAMGLVGQLNVQTITCEHTEDVAVVTGAGPIHAQVKSRRSHLEPHSVGWVAAQIAALLDRHHEALERDPACTVAIVLESLTSALEPTGWSDVVTPGTTTYTALAATDSFGDTVDAVDPALLGRVRVVHAPRPRAAAVRLLSQEQGMLPAVAEFCVARLRQALADAADANGEKDRTQPVVLTATELQRLRDVTVETVDARSLSQALLDGTAETLDLVTPLDDPYFWFGVDAQPGHVAAGYLVPRERETQQIVDGLFGRRSVLVAGPSGAGKSALTWLAAAATGEEIVWYRIRRLDADAVAGLIRLARGLRAGLDGMKVGFIVDDAGRVPGPWDALVSESAAHSGIYVLGSIRSEDLPLLKSKRKSFLVRPRLGDTLADAMYQRLAGDAATEWGDWREAFQLSGGLLLEYMHILTAGERLDDTIEAQVGARLDDVTRHGELQVLRLVGLAASYGCTIRLDRVRAELGLSEDALAVALRRLYDEHLIRPTNDGAVGGLHELRSAAIVRATHALGSPDVRETARRLLGVLDGEDLTVVVAAILEPGGESLDVLRSVGRHTAASPASLLQPVEIREVLAADIQTRPDPGRLAAALHGLRIAALRRTAHGWSRTMDELGVPRTVQQTAVLLSLGTTEISSLPLDPSVAAAIPQIRAALVPEFRDGLEQAVTTVLEISGETASIETAELLLLAAADWNAPMDALSRFASAVARRHRQVPLDRRGALLIAARLHGPMAGAVVAEGFGGEPHLLETYGRSHPWLFDVHRATVDADNAVAAKLLFVDTTAVGTDPAIALAAYGTDNVHDAVLTACREMLALQPSATRAIVAAVGADELPVGYGQFRMADKSIPRENLPADAEVAWNRVRTATAAELAGDVSATARLAAEVAVIEQLTTAMTRFLDQWVRGCYQRDPLPAAARATWDRLANLVPPATALPSPVLPVSLGVQLRRYANPRHAVDLPPNSSSADLARSMITNLAPRLLFGERLMSIVAYTGTLLGQIDQLRQRTDWQLIANPPLARLAKLAELMRDLHDVLAEVASSEHQHDTLRSLRRAATGTTPLLAAAAAARQAAAARTDHLARRMQECFLSTASTLPVRTEIITRPCDDRYSVVWPPRDFAIVARSDNPVAIVQLIPIAQQARTDILPLATSLTILGALGDCGAPPLTYQVFDNTVFPRPDHAANWLAHAQLPVADAPNYAAAVQAESYIGILSTLSVLQVHRSPQPVEEAVAERASTQLDQTLYVLANAARSAVGEPIQHQNEGNIALTDAAAATVPGQALLTIHGWYRGVHAEQLTAAGETDTAPDLPVEPGSFAKRTAAVLRGEDDELAQSILDINFALLVYDIAPEHAFGALDQPTGS